MDFPNTEKLSLIVSQLTSLHQLVSEHSSLQETTFTEALALTEAEQESTPRLYSLFSRSPLSPIPEEDEEADLAEISLLLIKNMTIAFNRVSDTEQAIVNLYKDYIETTVPGLKRAKTTLQRVQTQYDHETEKVDMLTERLASLQEELEQIQQTKYQQDWCEDCNENKEKAVNAEGRVRKMKKEWEEMREQSDSVNARRAKAEAETNRLKETYESLKETYEETVARLEASESAFKAKTAHEEELLRRAALLEDESDQLKPELLDLKKTKELLEVTNSDLIRRLEAAQAQSAAMTESLQDCETENQATKQSLEKARILVKRLNEESESLAKLLQVAESRDKQSRKDSHRMDRMLADMHKKVQETDVMRKTEERLRQEIAALKQDLKRTDQEKSAEIDTLHGSIVTLVDEKAELEGGLVSLEEKLGVIERENGERDRALQTSQALAKDLEAELAQREVDIRRMRDEAEARESEKEAEIALYKRQAENVLRYYTSLQSAGDSDLNRSRLFQSSSSSPMKKKTQVKLTTTSRPAKEDENKENLDSSKLIPAMTTSPENAILQLEEALHRETVLKREIERLVGTEGRFLKERVAELANFEAAFRPEVERWMLRNEEMEQRLLETVSKGAQMLRLLQDCQKTVLIKSRQMTDQKKVSDSLRSELQATVDFLMVELQNRDQLILEEFVPRSQATLSSSLSAAHGKIQQMNIDFSRLRSTAEEACSLLEREKDRSDSLLTDNQRLTDELIALKDNFEHWVRLVTENRAIPCAQGSLAGDSQGVDSFARYITELLDREKELSNELTEKKRLFQELNAAKQESDLMKQRYVDEIRGMEMLYKEKETKWANERTALADEIRQIKGIAQKDSDAKLQLQTQLEGEVDNYREEVETLHSQLAARNAEAVAMHKRLSEVQKSLDALTSEYDVAKTRLLTEVESLEIQLRTTQDELAKTKVQARESQYEVRTMAERHEQTIQALHAEGRKGEKDNRPKSVLAAYHALSAKASPYGSPTHQDLDSSDKLVQELYLVKSALKRCEEKNSMLEEDLKASEQALARKTVYTSDLEQQLEFFRSRKEGNQMFVDTDVDTFKMDISDMRAEPQAQYESLEEQLSRLKKKRESEKRSFQKRVKEFELILRYLEDQINRLTDSTPRPSNPKMAVLISELSVKNSTLDAWLKTLSQKLDSYGKVHSITAARERKTCADVASVLISAGVSPQEAKRTLDYVNSEGSEVDRASKDLISLLRTALLSGGLTRHRRLESFGAIRAVLIDLESADILLSVTQEVSELERLWRERAANLLQVSTKADDLVSSVRRMDRSHPSSDRILDKVLDMFQKIFRSFQSDLSGDLLHIASLSESLNQVLSSSPEADSSQIVTISSYHRRTAQIVRDERPRNEGQPLLDQMERLNSELTRH